MKIIDLSTTEIRTLSDKKIDGRFNPNGSSVILVLSEEDLFDDDLLCKIKGTTFNMVLIPKSMRDLFESDKRIRPAILTSMYLTGSVEYF